MSEDTRKLKLQILGTGCAKCKTLAEHAEKAAKELGLEYTIEKVADLKERRILT